MEHVAGGGGEEGGDLFGVEFGAVGEEFFGDCGAGGFVGEEGGEGFGDTGFGGELGEAEEFFVVGCAVELGEELGDAGGAGLGIEGEGGEDAGFDGEFGGGFGVEEGGGEVGVALEEHADEEAFELAVVGFADGDLFVAAGGLDGGAVGEGGFGEGEEAFNSPCIWQMLSQALDQILADFRITISLIRGQ